jgi:hypothetical protein
MFGHKQILDCLYMVLVEDGGGKYSFSWKTTELYFPDLCDNMIQA